MVFFFSSYEKNLLDNLYVQKLVYNCHIYFLNSHETIQSVTFTYSSLVPMKKQSTICHNEYLSSHEVIQYTPFTYNFLVCSNHTQMCSSHEFYSLNMKLNELQFQSRFSSVVICSKIHLWPCPNIPTVFSILFNKTDQALIHKKVGNSSFL